MSWVIDAVKKLPCTACSKQGGDAHHVTTVGAGGKDEFDNLMPLCREHHTMVHQIGWKKMCKNYPRVLMWLENAGRGDVIRRMNK